MKIWIDLSNSPHPAFFKPLAAEFRQRGHTLETTARDFAQTVALSRAAGFAPDVIGVHAGRKIYAKAVNLISRAQQLRAWAKDKKFDLAVSHNSHEHLLAARLLGIESVTLMDYEHHPANHFSFRIASRVIVPQAFPEAAIRKLGAAKKAQRYMGIKEDVYLADFTPAPDFREQLARLGVNDSDILVTIRTPAHDALYHRFDNELFHELLSRLSGREGVKVILLPRTEAQRERLRVQYSAPNMIWLERPLDGANLIAASDLVVSAGGTMNREAAALGVPTATIFAGRWAAIDEQLVGEGRLKRIRTRADLDALKIEKKSARDVTETARRARNVRAEVARLILGE
jgi:predicted glycosyltransferase